MQNTKFTTLLAFSMLVGCGLFLVGCGGNSGGTGETFISQDEITQQQEEEAAARAQYEPPAP